MNSLKRNAWKWALVIATGVMGVSALPVQPAEAAVVRPQAARKGTLIVWNHTPGVISFRIDGGSWVQMGSGFKKSLSLNAGRHTVVVKRATGQSRTYSVNVPAGGTTRLEVLKFW